VPELIAGWFAMSCARPAGHGVVMTECEALAWADERLVEAGRERAGDPEHVSVRPWATVLRVPTTASPVWLKASGPGTAFEAGLYDLLARVVPTHVLTPLAVDASRGWMLLPDGGASLGERLEGDALVEALAAALAQYGEVQRELAPQAGELLALGVADMRPEALPRRFEEALEATGARGTDLEAMRPQVAAWCERLAASPLPASLDHNDLHPWNVLAGEDGAFRYYDWGDSVVAHPFAAMLVPLTWAHSRLGATALDDPRLVRLRDAYLGGFADVAPHDELVATLELACRVAKIARALIWDRAVRAAVEQGEPIEERWTTAARETLESLRQDAWVGSG
jgi:hypothetical protein